jgi:hypothetical protein
MNIIETILAANFFTFYFITQNRFPEKWKLNFKPFNCPLCLTAWSGLALYLLPEIVGHSVLAMFGSGVLAPYFKNFLINIYNKFN